jgi:hypothetical protein
MDMEAFFRSAHPDPDSNNLRRVFEKIAADAIAESTSPQGFAGRHDPNALREGMPEPSYQGSHGRAWELSAQNAILTAEREGLKRPWANEDWPNICTWLIEAPYAHPIWHSYALSCIHLRPLPDLPPPHIVVPGATHEFHLFAIDPRADRSALIADGCFGPKIRPLVPQNFAAQLKCPALITEDSDNEARQLMDDLVHDICNRVINPDTDYRKQWIERFSGAMIK